MVREVAWLGLAAILAGCARYVDLVDQGPAPPTTSTPVPARAADLDQLLQSPVWHPVLDQLDCEVEQADFVSDPFPTRQWTPCGPGCQQAPLIPLFDRPTQTSIHSIAARLVDGSPFILYETRTESGNLIRLEHFPDSTVSALLVRNRACFLSEGGATSALGIALYDQAKNIHHLGRTSVASQQISWLKPIEARAPNSFPPRRQLTERFEVRQYLGIGSSEGVILVSELDSALKLVPANAKHINGDGDWLVSVSELDGFTLKPYENAPPVPLAVEEGRRILNARLEGPNVVFVTSGASSSDLKWHACSVGSTVRIDGPAIPNQPLGDDIAFGDGWAAIKTCRGDADCRYNLWQPQTNATRDVVVPTSSPTSRLLSVTSSQLVIVQGDDADALVVIQDLATL